MKQKSHAIIGVVCMVVTAKVCQLTWYLRNRTSGSIVRVKEGFPPHNYHIITCSIDR